MILVRFYKFMQIAQSEILIFEEDSDIYNYKK